MEGPTWNSHYINYSSCKQCTLSEVTGPLIDDDDQESYLAWHHFPIDTADVDPGVEAGLVMSVDNVSSPCLISSDTAIVRALL